MSGNGSVTGNLSQMKLLNLHFFLWKSMNEFRLVFFLLEKRQLESTRLTGDVRGVYKPMNDGKSMIRK